MSSNKRDRQEEEEKKVEIDEYPRAEFVCLSMKSYMGQKRIEVREQIHSDIKQFMEDPDDHRGTAIRVFISDFHRAEEIIRGEMDELQKKGYRAWYVERKPTEQTHDTLGFNVYLEYDLE